LGKAGLMLMIVGGSCMSAGHLISDVSIITHTSSNDNFQLGYRISPPQGRRFAASGKLTLRTHRQQSWSSILAVNRFGIQSYTCT